MPFGSVTLTYLNSDEFSTVCMYSRRVARDVMFIDLNGDRSLAPNYLVLITDGRSDNRTFTWQEAMQAREQGITILVVSYQRRCSDDINPHLMYK